ncbi:MAG TPA: GYF domain-containing protein [Pirellulales bacterium]|nr:GYF domain-containing protein [Pirellulales bacterium]
MATWYYLDGERAFGPVTIRDLWDRVRSGGMDPRTLITQDSGKNWQPILDLLPPKDRRFLAVPKGCSLVMAAWSTRSGWPRPHNTVAVCHIHCPGQTRLPGEFGYLVEAREGGFQFAASRQLWDVHEVEEMRVDHADPDRRLYRPCELDEVIRNTRNGELNYVVVDSPYLVPVGIFFPQGWSLRKTLFRWRARSLLSGDYPCLAYEPAGARERVRADDGYLALPPGCLMLMGDANMPEHGTKSALCHLHCPGKTMLPGEFGFIVQVREQGFGLGTSRPVADARELAQMSLDDPDPDMRLYRPSELDEAIRNTRHGSFNYVVAEARSLAIVGLFYPRGFSWRKLWFKCRAKKFLRGDHQVLTYDPRRIDRQAWFASRMDAEWLPC